MRALVLERQHELSLRDIDLPQKVGPDDVKIKIHTVGICGSDVHYYTHGRIGPFVVKAPMVLGHEAAGHRRRGRRRTSRTSRSATASAWSRAFPIRTRRRAGSACTMSIRR